MSTTPAELAAGTTSFNYYPRAMVRLAGIIAYEDVGTIAASAARLGQTVVWGPRQEYYDEISDALMYVVRRDGTDEYTVVIRGTNMYSWYSWMKEDFAVGRLRQFDELAWHAPSTALISQGTFRGMQLLLEMKDRHTGKTVADFLKEEKPSALYVTGHSLGGTLTPPMFAYLNDRLYGGGPVRNMALFSFAGLTPGNRGFNEYFNRLTTFPFRYHNTLDVAPFCWYSQADAEAIYRPYGLYWGEAESLTLGEVFADAARNRYQQPLGDRKLTGTFDPHWSDDYLWVSQAMHQHHGSTYRKLIDAAYPLPQVVEFEGILQPEDAPAV